MLERIIGVVTLKVATYRQIAEDQSGTKQAAIIVIIASLIRGFFEYLVKVDPQSGVVSASIGGAIVGAIVVIIFGLIAWAASSWVLAFVAKLFGGKTDTGEMLRVVGYVQVFNIVSVLNVLALISLALTCVVGLVGFIVLILSIIGYVIGVREAGEFSTGKAVITAIIAAIVTFVIMLIPSAIVGLIA